MKGKIIKFQPKSKQVPYRKPKPVKQLNCHVCNGKATHVVLLELRAEPGPPLKENEVIRVVCEEHVSTDFDHWVPVWAFKKLCIDLQKEAGIILDKK